MKVYYVFKLWIGTLLLGPIMVMIPLWLESQKKDAGADIAAFWEYFLIYFFYGGFFSIPALGVSLIFFWLLKQLIPHRVFLQMAFVLVAAGLLAGTLLYLRAGLLSLFPPYAAGLILSSLILGKRHPVTPIP